jgi:sulfite reductase alpha subunit
MHGSTGDIILLGTRTEELEPTFAALTKNGFDLGGSGSALRTPACCVGMARCEWACIDTQHLCYELTMEYQDELHRPAWPYKFKFKVSGCPNDCVAAMARADFSIVGTWKGPIQIDQAGIAAYAAGEYPANGGAFGPDVKVDIAADVVGKCPQGCISFDGKELKIDNSNCVRCMNCINVMPRALKPGKERGCTISMGAKAPILEGAQISSVVVPWIPADEALDTIKDLAEKLWDWWDENGKNRERVGELMQRLGYYSLLEALELDFDPRMIKEPRSNPYIFYREDEVPGGFERDQEDYRKRHKA